MKTRTIPMPDVKAFIEARILLNANSCHLTSSASISLPFIDYHIAGNFQGKRGVIFLCISTIQIVRGKKFVVTQNLDCTPCAHILRYTYHEIEGRTRSHYTVQQLQQEWLVLPKQRCQDQASYPSFPISETAPRIFFFFSKYRAKTDHAPCEHNS